MQGSRASGAGPPRGRMTLTAYRIMLVNQSPFDARVRITVG